MTTQQIQSLVDAAASRYNIPPALLQSVASTESNYNPNAVSSAGALGVMQLMPATAASLGVTNPLDPAQNIDGGAKLLSQLLTQYNGDTALALAAYNAGPGAVSKYGGIPPYPETQNYVSTVLAGAGLPSADLTAADTTAAAADSSTMPDTASVGFDLSAVSPTTWTIAAAIALAVLLLNNKR